MWDWGWGMWDWDGAMWDWGGSRNEEGLVCAPVWLGRGTVSMAAAIHNIFLTFASFDDLLENKPFLKFI